MTTTAAYAAPVDAASPGKGCHIAANLAIAVGAFFTFALTMLLYATGSKLDEAFRDFGTPPNPVADIFLALGRLLASLGLAGSVAAAALAAGIVIIVGRAGRGSAALMTLIVLVPLVLFLAFPLSVVEPLSQMIESLQAAGSTP